jgi:glycosyltransferase involved in cell wall biosynthesis
VKFTLIVPYYRNQRMLERQALEWQNYPPNVNVIVVDDGSPEPAYPTVKLAYDLGAQVRLLRVIPDIPWNRNGARNLGVMQARTDWIVHVDIDHIMPMTTASELFHFHPEPGNWYRFARYRYGKADFTRRKDDIPDDQTFGKIKPHMDSYAVSRKAYLDLGGYDEDYSGSLGGGTPFVKELEAKLTRVDLPEPYLLHVYTTDAVKDASDIHLSRDHTRYTMINRQKKLNPTKKPMCQFEWKEIGL